MATRLSGGFPIIPPTVWSGRCDHHSQHAGWLVIRPRHQRHRPDLLGAVYLPVAPVRQIVISLEYFQGCSGFRAENSVNGSRIPAVESEQDLNNEHYIALAGRYVWNAANILFKHDE